MLKIEQKQHRLVGGIGVLVDLPVSGFCAGLPVDAAHGIIALIGTDTAQGEGILQTRAARQHRAEELTKRRCKLRGGKPCRADGEHGGAGSGAGFLQRAEQIRTEDLGLGDGVDPPRKTVQPRLGAHPLLRGQGQAVRDPLGKSAVFWQQLKIAAQAVAVAKDRQGQPFAVFHLLVHRHVLPCRSVGSFKSQEEAHALGPGMGIDGPLDQKQDR